MNILHTLPFVIITVSERRHVYSGVKVYTVCIVNKFKSILSSKNYSNWRSISLNSSFFI